MYVCAQPKNSPCYSFSFSSALTEFPVSFPSSLCSMLQLYLAVPLGKILVYPRIGSHLCDASTAPRRHLAGCPLPSQEKLHPWISSYLGQWRPIKKSLQDKKTNIDDSKLLLAKRVTALKSKGKGKIWSPFAHFFCSVQIVTPNSALLCWNCLILLGSSVLASHLATQPLPSKSQWVRTEGHRILTQQPPGAWTVTGVDQSQEGCSLLGLVPQDNESFLRNQKKITGRPGVPGNRGAHCCPGLSK